MPPQRATRHPALEPARLRKQRDRGLVRRRALTHWAGAHGAPPPTSGRSPPPPVLAPPVCDGVGSDRAVWSGRCWQNTPPGQNLGQDLRARRQPKLESPGASVHAGGILISSRRRRSAWGAALGVNRSARRRRSMSGDPMRYEPARSPSTVSPAGTPTSPRKTKRCCAPCLPPQAWNLVSTTT
jgi:hypothetical protein